MAEKENKLSSEEQIGFHKGALSTLAKEREELQRLLGIVEQLMQMHIKSLQDLGIDLTKIARESKQDKKPTKKKPIEDILS